MWRLSFCLYKKIFHYIAVLIFLDTCYLDHVGAGLYANSQIDSITEYLKNNLLGNPHSLNLSSKYCHDAVDQIRFQYVKIYFIYFIYYTENVYIY